MTIDWQKEVEARKEDLLEDLSFTCQQRARRLKKVTPDAPFGPGPQTH